MNADITLDKSILKYGQLAVAWRALGWRLASYLVLTVLIGQLFLGKNFYGVFLSEVLIIAAWVCVLFFYLGTLQLPRLGYMGFLLWLSTGYLAYSFFQPRDLYWIARQGAFVLYASVAVITYRHVVLHKCGFNKCLPFLAMLGVGLMFFHKSVHFDQGHAFFTAYLLFLMGLAYFMVTARNIILIMIVTLAAVLLSIATNKHSAFAIAPLVMFWVVVFIRYKPSRPMMMIIGLIGLIISPILLSGLTDVNATWRFMYWAGVIEESWNRGFLLLGKGFGVPFFPVESEHFGQLLSQVSGLESGHRNAEYQLMAVPPHNGLLTILIYTGLPGVLAFCYPFLRGFLMAIQNRSNQDGMILFVAASGMLMLLVSNQFIEVPYNAVIFWMVYGALIGSIRTLNSTRMEPE